MASQIGNPVAEDPWERRENHALADAGLDCVAVGGPMGAALNVTIIKGLPQWPPEDGVTPACCGASMLAYI